MESRNHHELLRLPYQQEPHHCYTPELFEHYKADGTISGGMLPKIENAINALNAGVKKVVITLASAINGSDGTVIKL